MNVYTGGEEDALTVKEACSSCKWCERCSSDALSGEFSLLDLGVKCKGYEKTKEKRNGNRDNDRDGEDRHAS